MSDREKAPVSVVTVILYGLALLVAFALVMALVGCASAPRQVAEWVCDTPSGDVVYLGADTTRRPSDCIRVRALRAEPRRLHAPNGGAK